MTGDFVADGVTIIRQFASAPVVTALREANGPTGPGTRNFELPSNVTDFIVSEMAALASRLAGHPMRPVRVLLFDKSPRSNWSVPWHQDRTIAVRTRHDVAGFGPWSSKDGIVHVEPPVSVLEGMLTLRLFVDDCDADKGPLEVARGSHRNGRISAGDVKSVATASDVFVATGRASDVLAMRLLAVHSSRKSASPGHRRVLHVDYSPSDLPMPLEWAIAFGRPDPP